MSKTSVWIALVIASSLMQVVVAENRSVRSVQSGVLGAGKTWATPYYVVDSGVDGPTVFITGGIHGNEPSGARSAEQIRHWPIVRGKMIVIPRVNAAALDSNRRRTPGASADVGDVNRNFPSPDIAENPCGEIATAVWNLVVDQQPDWVFDLHEGFQFNISHKPKPGKDKSVGSSIIFDSKQDIGSLVDRMVAAANSSVSNPARRFVPLGRGPKKTTLAAAAIDVLNSKAMILETTFQHQRLPVRTRQHRAMMNVALTQLGMLTSNCIDVMTPPADKRRGHTFVALYDDEGSSNNGVENLSRVFDMATDITVAHLSADDIRPEVLGQFDVVVFGGGSGSVEARAIGKKGAKAVTQFVKEGGGYVGVCAGAFLCSAHYSWSLNLVDTHVLTGKRNVEGLGPKSMWYRGEFSSQKMQLTEEGQKLFPNLSETVDVRYRNGPIVSPKNSFGLKPYSVLAWFRSEKVLYPPQSGTMIDTPAIVKGEFGRGQVISISPHPEATRGLESMLAIAVKAVAR
ncbi:MAG: BPL-N domain-containing protein [Planctomycetota bacterium]